MAIKKILILDDSVVVANCWAKWLKEVSHFETITLNPADDWKSQLESEAPFAMLIDATSQRIPILQIINLLTSKPKLANTKIVLSCGYTEQLEILLDNYTKLLEGRSTAFRKPISQSDFTEQVSAFFNENGFIPEENQSRKGEPPMMKNIFGENSTNPIADRFGWLANEGAVMAYSITLPNGTPGLQGGKDCGDLAQGGAYFRDLASQIGNELGCDLLKELQVGCDGCRLLSTITADGHNVDILTGPTADLPSLSRSIK